MRSHLIKNILKNNLEWMKKDLILILLFIILVKASITFLDIPSWGKVILILILFVKTLLFSNHAITPARVNSVDNFSWKFIQSLPLTRHEIILSVALSSLMSAIPLLVWGICFFPLINSKILDGDFDPLKLAAHSVIFILISGVFSINSGIQFPRREFQKLNANKVLLRFLRNALILVTGLVYLGMGIVYLEVNYDINLGHFLVKGLNFVADLLKSWWAIPVSMIGLVLTYFEVMRVWDNEKISYSSNVWLPKKEYPLLGGSIGLLLLAYVVMDFRTPTLYLGEVQKMVYKKDYYGLERISDLNTPNKYGVTPMFVAIKEGDLGMVSYLRRRGAGFEGVISRKNDRYKGYDAIMLAIEIKNVDLLKILAENNVKLNEFKKDLGWYPIHAASALCHSEGVDFLLKNGNDVNALNKQGETPIVVAARANCLSAVVALKEAGGNFDIADKNGKLALDKVPKKHSEELKYFLEKHTRAPASKN